MNNIKQKIITYANYTPLYDITESIRQHIENGWRVHTCLERDSSVLVVLEKECKIWIKGTQIIFKNAKNLTTEDVEGKPINMKYGLSGTFTHADTEYIYGVLNNSRELIYDAFSECDDVIIEPIDFCLIEMNSSILK